MHAIFKDRCQGRAHVRADYRARPRAYCHPVDGTRSRAARPRCGSWNGRSVSVPPCGYRRASSRTVMRRYLSLGGGRGSEHGGAFGFSSARSCTSALDSLSLLKPHLCPSKAWLKNVGSLLYRFRFKAFGLRYQLGSRSSSRRRIRAPVLRHDEKQIRCRHKGPYCAPAETIKDSQQTSMSLVDT